MKTGWQGDSKTWKQVEKETGRQEDSYIWKQVDKKTVKTCKQVDKKTVRYENMSTFRNKKL